MSAAWTDVPCPCESGLAFAACCGVADRATRQTIIIPPDTTGADCAALTEPLRAALDQISERPDLFPARINFVKHSVLWIKMSRRWYDESVFLDPARIKGTCALETNLAFLEQACERMPWRPTA